jgi:hypothetical protein
MSGASAKQQGWSKITVQQDVELVSHHADKDPY